MLQIQPHASESYSNFDPKIWVLLEIRPHKGGTFLICHMSSDLESPFDINPSKILCNLLKTVRLQ